MKTKEEIDQIISHAKELGLLAVEIEGIKFILPLKDVPKMSVVEDLKAEDIVKPLSPLDEYSDEEILYWSSGYFDELQAKKEAQKNKKQIDDELKATGS